MGLKSVLIELENIEMYHQIVNFIELYNQKYDLIGLLYHNSLCKYYALIECEGNYFCRVLNTFFPEKIKYLEDFPAIETSQGCQIKNALYFHDVTECLIHYQQNKSISAG